MVDVLQLSYVRALFLFFWSLCGLSNDSVSSSEYIVSNDGTIDKKWTWNDMEGHRHGLI
jgi:hypothetical protein